MIGMDVDAVRRTASELRRKAGEIRAVEARIDAVVSQISGSWQGNTARRFVSDWHGHHRAALLLLADRVDGLGQSALNNAGEQENASRAGGARAGHGSGSARPGGQSALDFLRDPWVVLGISAIGAIDAIKYLRGRMTISTLGRLDVPLFKLAYNPAFRKLLRVGAAADAIGDIRAAWNRTDGQDLWHRWTAVVGTGVADAALLYPPIAIADIVTGGLFDAGINGTVSIISHGVKGAGEGAMDAASEPNQGSLPSYAHGVMATLGGFMSGANEGINLTNKDIADGVYGPGLQKANDVVDAGISSAFGVSWAVNQGAAEGFSEAAAHSTRPDLPGRVSDSAIGAVRGAWSGFGEGLDVADQNISQGFYGEFVRDVRDDAVTMSRLLGND